MHGGKRKGSGKRLVYGEPTIRTMFRVPVSKKQEFRDAVNAILTQYRICNKNVTNK